MLRPWFILLIACAMLLGATVLPTIAHAHGGATVHALESFDSHHQTLPSSDADSEDETDRSAHHHCGATLVARVATLPHKSALTAARPLARLVPPMSSMSRVPPTEPPAA